MSISRVTGYQTSDGSVFLTESAAKEHEGRLLIRHLCDRLSSEFSSAHAADVIYNHRTEFRQALDGIAPERQSKDGCK